MEGGRRTSTVRQLQMLVEFAEANVDLALGRLRSKEARELSKRLWRDCAEMLNSEGLGRLPKEWTKVWNDLKSRVRPKLTSLTLSQRGTGGGSKINITLSPLEERVANIIGRDIGPIPNVAQDPFEQTLEENQDLVVESIDINMEHNYVSNDYTDEQLHLPGPSYMSLPYQSPSRPTQYTTQPPQSPSQPPTQPPQSPPQMPNQPPPRMSPPSVTSTPRRRRLRPRQRVQRPSRVNTQAQTSRAALNESRAMVMRIEELRTRTDSMLAQSALRQAEAAKALADAAVISAEANRLQAQTMATLYQSLHSLVPAVQLYMKSRSSSGTKRVLSSDDE